MKQMLYRHCSACWTAAILIPQLLHAGTARIMTGADAAGAPPVKAFAAHTLTPAASFSAYSQSFTGGVYVAVGDVDGDSFADLITGVDKGAGPQVKVFSGATGAEIRSFFAYSGGFQGGVRVAAGDVNGDGRAEIITGPGPGGGPHIKVFDGATLAELQSFFAYDLSFTGGVYVAAGDLNGDGRAEIAVGGGCGSQPIKVFGGLNGSFLNSCIPYPDFAGGVRVAVGDVDSDGRAELITVPAAGTGSQVKVFEGRSLTERPSLFACAETYTNGVFIGTSLLTEPRFAIDRPRTTGKLELSWLSGSICKLETNSILHDPKSWAELPAVPDFTGNRQHVTLSANVIGLSE